MHKLYELLVPSWAETVLYLAVSLLLLLILNVSELWGALLHSAGTDTATARSIDDSIHDLIVGLTSISDPQLVNAFVWGATAALGIFIAIALAGFVRATRQSAVGLESRSNEISFAENLIVRMAALGGAVLGSLFALLGLLPVFSYVFASRLSNLTESWQNGPVALLAWLGVAVSGYALAILCRLVVLRIRVFSAVID